MRLYDAIKQIYGRYAFLNFSDWRGPECEEVHSRYIEIPINKDTFEVPVFATHMFVKTILDCNDVESLIAWVHKSSTTSYYKSLEGKFKELLSDTFQVHRLMKVQMKEDEPVYYICQGGVFDANFQPFVLCSWVVDRTVDSNTGTYKYSFIRPILRVSPECFIDKSDSVRRFISNKFMSELLTVDIGNPKAICVSSSVFCNLPIDNVLLDYPSAENVKVEIEKIPFETKTTDVPSITADNDSLLQVALDHFNEVAL